jgi:hypothetical protein
MRCDRPNKVRIKSWEKCIVGVLVQHIVESLVKRSLGGLDACTTNIDVRCDPID